MSEHIFIDRHLPPQLAEYVSKPFSSYLVLTDENTFQYCYPVLESILPEHSVIQIPSGEENKTLQTCEDIWEALTEAEADRHCLLINLGGGVIGDIGGFAAGCYKRGIKFINVPTTLLAMVDASIGGKTAIDFQGYKNHIGLFSQPEGVFVATQFLQTLPERELVSGFAEVLKHYLICNADYFNAVCEQRLPLADYDWPKIVETNVLIKSHIVRADPYEVSIRKALNFGHTIGHAVESFFLQTPRKKLLHGEAVAVGIITESFISMEAGFITEDELEDISDVILHYFKLPVITDGALKEILDLVAQDKKAISGLTQFTLLNGIGNYCINNVVEEDAIIQSLNYYNSLL